MNDLKDDVIAPNAAPAIPLVISSNPATPGIAIPPVNEDANPDTLPVNEDANPDTDPVNEDAKPDTDPVNEDARPDTPVALNAEATPLVLDANKDPLAPVAIELNPLVNNVA